MITVWMANGTKIEGVSMTFVELRKEMFDLGERGLTFLEVTDGRGFVHHLRVREISNVVELKD